MDKYRICTTDNLRNLNVEQNNKNNCYRLVQTATKNGKEKIVAKTPEFEQVSQLASEQNREKYALCVGLNKSNLYVVLNDLSTVEIKNYTKTMRDEPENQIKTKLLNEPSTNLSWNAIGYDHEAIKKAQIYCHPTPWLVLIKGNEFGEILYDMRNNKISATYDYIGSPTFSNHRLVKIKNLNNSVVMNSQSYLFIDKDFVECDKPFVSLVNTTAQTYFDQLAEMSEEKIKNTIVYDDEYKFYILDKNYKKCSKRYDAINFMDDMLIGAKHSAINITTKNVILNDNGKEVSPYFLDYFTISNNIKALRLNGSDYVIYNSSKDAQEKLSGKLTGFPPIHIDKDKKIILGVVEQNDELINVIFDTNNMKDVYKVDGNVAELMINFMSGWDLDTKLVNQVIYNNVDLIPTMNAFNNCLQQDVPEAQRVPITNNRNICSKFLTKLKERATYRVNAKKQKQVKLDEQHKQLGENYKGYVETKKQKDLDDDQEIINIQSEEERLIKEIEEENARRIAELRKQNEEKIKKIKEQSNQRQETYVVERKEEENKRVSGRKQIKVQKQEEKHLQKSSTDFKTQINKIKSGQVPTQEVEAPQNTDEVIDAEIVEKENE